MSLKKADIQQKDLALSFGVSASVLIRELSRNSDQHGNRHEEANDKALDCRKILPRH